MHFEFAFFYFVLILGIEPIKTFIHSRSSSKTIPDSRPKWAKFIAVLGRPKGPKNLTLRGCTYLCGLYKGILREYPPPPGDESSSVNLYVE